jgi:hypothetical protein
MKALALARKGLPVFPCHPGTKRPLTQHGFKDASTDEAVITAWWTKWPDALIGIPTGYRFSALDVDGPRHLQALIWFEQQGQSLAGNRRHYTRSGGFHVLMRPHPQLTNSQGKILTGVDTRGLGGYVIWWPAHGCRVENPDVISEVPLWLLTALHPPRPARQQYLSSRGFDPDASVAGLIRTIARANEGERNGITYWASCRFAELVKNGKLSEGEAVDLIIEAASRAGLPHVEARRTAQSAFKTIGI